MKKYFLLRIFMYFGSLFFFFEFILHLLGLNILEHDKIFLFTHDRYIALFSLTYSSLLILVSTNFEKYKLLFMLTMTGIFLAMINALNISFSGGYITLFPVYSLDNNLKFLGILFFFWYFLTWLLFYFKR